MNRNSPNFDPNWFRRVVDSNWSEGQRFDFKYTWKGLLLSEEKTVQFSRHIIAFANISYRTGKPCFIFFGVDDTTHKFHDMYGCFPGDPPEKLKDPNSHISTLMEDGVLRPIINELSKWIGPEVPDLQLEYGDVPQEGDERIFVAWLRIFSQNAKQPYYLLRSYKNYYRKGEVFIRKGSSSVKLDSSQIDSLVCYKDAAYLTQVEWKKLIDWSRTGDFIKARDYLPYIEPRSNNSELLLKDSILNALDEKHQFIAIFGPAGSGKSLFLRRIACDLAEKHPSVFARRDNFGEDIQENQVGIREDNYSDAPEEDYSTYAVKDIIQELEPTPILPIPIFFSLRTDFPEADQFQKILEKLIADVIEYSKPLDLWSLFKIPGSRWVLLFDGADELHNAEDRINKLLGWISALPSNVQVIITSRPKMGIDNFDLAFSIAPLQAKEICLLIGKRLWNSRKIIARGEENFDKKEMIKKIISWVKGNRELLPILKNHRALDAFTKYFDNYFVSYEADIDKDIVKIGMAEQYLENKQALGESSLPIIKEQIIDFDDDSFFFEDEETEDESEGPEDEVLGTDYSNFRSIGELLRVINLEMRKQEVKRKCWQSAAQEIDDKARRQLEEVAWISDWASVVIDVVDYEQQNLIEKPCVEWNENIGYLTRVDYRKKKFACPLYQHYFAAEYSCYLKKIEPKLLGGSREAKKVRQLHKELREANGLMPLVNY